MARKLSAKTQAKRLQDEIGRLYGIHSQGLQIDIMKIGLLYRDVEGQHALGVDLETAVKAAIAVYCEPADGSVMTMTVGV